MGWLLWHGICCKTSFTSPSGLPRHPSMKHPWWVTHTIPFRKSLMEALPATLDVPAPSKAAITQTKQSSKKPSLERHYFSHKEMFLYKEHPRHMHTQIFLSLSILIVQRQFMTSSRNFPHAPFIQMLSTFKFTHHRRILFAETHSILSSVGLGSAGLRWTP